jgi:hypothetical protein
MMYRLLLDTKTLRLLRAHVKQDTCVCRVIKTQADTSQRPKRLVRSPTRQSTLLLGKPRLTCTVLRGGRVAEHAASSQSEGMLVRPTSSSFRHYGFAEPAATKDLQSPWRNSRALLPQLVMTNSRCLSPGSLPSNHLSDV